MVDGLATGTNRVAANLRWRPEWPITVLVAGAWAAMLVAQSSESRGPADSPSTVFAHDHQNAAGDSGAWAADAWTGVLDALPAWTLMSVAMMMPIALPAVRHTALNSIRTRRRRAMGVYTVVYLAIWTGFGFFALAGERLVRQTLGLDGRVLLAATLALAAGWQLSRPKRRALSTCRRTVPLPPVGRRADAGCIRFALTHGRRCVTSCWALMLVMATVGGANPVWMLALSALISVEELTLLGRRLRRPSAAVLAVTAAATALGS